MASSASLTHSSPFAMVSTLHSFEVLRRSAATERTPSASPQRLSKTVQMPAGLVDTTSRTVSSFLRHKMRKLTKFEPEYVRKLMSSNMIKTQRLPQMMTEPGQDSEVTPVRPKTCATSLRPAFNSTSPRPITLISKRPLARRQRELNRCFERQLANYEHTKTSVSTSLQSMERQRSMEKTMVKSFFGTVKLISDIECRHMRHVPTIFYSKVESHAGYLEDAQHISTEYRKGISDPSRFVGKIERKRWGRLKARPQLRLNLPKT